MKKGVFFFSFILLLSALCLYSQEIEENPFYEKLFDEGKYYYSVGNYAEAVENIKIAFFGFLDNHEKLTESYIYLAVCHSLLNNQEQSLYFSNEIKRLNLQQHVPSIQQPYDLVSRYKALTSSQPSAKIIPQKELQIMRDPVTTPIQRQVVSQKKEDPSELEAGLRQAEELVKQKNIEAAKSSLFALLGKFPNDIRAFTSLGVIYVNELEFQNAIQILMESKSIEQKNIKACYYLGVAHLAEKNYQQAAREFKIVIDQNPQYKSTPTLYKICLDNIKE